ncbi:MAG: long-chain fatty acid--CoA ligase [Verrucomicrobiales bacterium]|nr:long-chain fatty acid--CoA ligase [Verrucomicrobiales bacterium]
MNLHSAFLDQARRRPDSPAVFFGADTFSYDHFAAGSAVVGGGLRSRFGIQPGDRVGLWLHNCPEFITALFGILRAGAVAVPVNNFLKPEEVAYILRDAGCSMLITDDTLKAAMDTFLIDEAGLPTLTVGEFSALPVPGKDFADAASGAEELAVLIYTSGTTGHPKGAMLSHANLLHNVASCQEALDILAEDRIAVLLPMFHSFMMTVGILLPLLTGASQVLVKSLNPPKNAVGELIHHQATILPAIPQFFRALAAAPVPPGLALRLCVSGAAPLPVDTLTNFNARYPVPLIEGYGLSEASPVVSLNPLHGTKKPGSVGLPIPNVELTIRSEAGEALPQGETGELCVRGGNVMSGYWRMPDATAETIRDGWLYTGDMGHQDADGYTFITDRKKDMLLVNGINVYPREIEELLHRYQGIREAAVIGRPDARRGEQPVAYLALVDGEGLDREALRHYLREHLADYKVPRRYHILPALPRNATGKILKTTLRKMPEPATA